MQVALLAEICETHKNECCNKQRILVQVDWQVEKYAKAPPEICAITTAGEYLCISASHECLHGPDTGCTAECGFSNNDENIDVYDQRDRYTIKRFKYYTIVTCIQK